MNGLYDVSVKVLDATDTELDEKKFAKLVILANCLSDLSAAAHLLQCGYFRPGGTVLRAVVENISLAVAIHQKPEIYEKYKAGKYNVPNAVTVARNFIDEIGKVNGLLSNLFTHEPHKTIGRGIRTSKGSNEIMLVPGIDHENGRTFSILTNLTALSAIMLGESLEWCFAEYLESFMFWEKIDNDHIRTKPNELKSISLSLSEELEKLL